ncbi:nectin-2-like [Lytechinus pictus]|uniref:nectin-2-like n=1 Tax=Lytechinus pictus TaxID=7653 RepID=UPI0030BA13BB
MLTPLVFCWMFVGAASFNLLTEESITAVLGRNVSLPCSFSVPVLAVYWYKHEFSGAPDDDAILIASDYMGFTDPIPGFERFRIGDDYRLVINDVLLLDETTYSCIVVPHHFDNQRGYTDLRVIALANPQVPIISSCETTEPGRCSFIIEEDEEGVTLDCNIYNARPPANVTWTSSDGSVKNNTEQQIYEKDGVFNISSQLWVSINEIGEDFVCVATGESVNGTSTLVVTVKYLPEIGLSSGSTAWIATSLLFLVIIAVLTIVYILRKRKRQDQLADLEDELLPLVAPKQGMQQLTETDILDVTHETNLDHGQLRNLLTELHIEAADMLTEKDRNTRASDLKLKAFHVLCVWRKTEGINATRGTLRNALHKCGYIEALGILDERWGLNSQDNEQNVICSKIGSQISRKVCGRLV